jgi:hypothetical protein
MTDMENDRDLRERFARLREEDRARTPSYHTTVAALAQRRRRRRPRWAIRLAAAAAAVVTITVAHQYRQAAVRRERARAEVRHRLPARPSWAAPTDFLLNTPGSRLLNTVPSFGSASWIRPGSTTLGTRNRS